LQGGHVTLLEEFGIAIRARREELGLSQELLAELANLHRTYIGSIERGERNVSLKNIIKLCAALKIKPSDLMKTLDDHIKY
jgi:transcriptional regulator with XRE-family HTH domain